MSRCSSLGVVVLLVTLAAAFGPPTRADGVRASGDSLSRPLPAGLTPAEALLPLPPVEGGLRAAPTGVVYCPAEYEPQEGIFFAWQGFTNLLTEMTVAITTEDPDATVFIVVSGASQQTSATSTLTSAGADLTQVEFITATLDSVWIRDYGPRFIRVDGERAIVDHTYNRPRDNDNAFNDTLCTLWGEPQYQIPLTHGGGNFHLFATGEAFMSDLIETENPSLTEQQIKDYYAAYQNLDVTIYPGFPTSFDSTQHIDMWMLPTGDNQVIIGQYASSTGTPYTITENAVADLTSRGYTVYRTPGWTSGGTHYTYTNAVVLNNLVFMPKFNDSRDAQALSVFQTAFAGRTIHQIDCTGIIGYAGALHCIAMHVPSAVIPAEPQVQVQTPDGGELLLAGESYEITWTATDDVAVTSVDILLSTDSGATFDQTIALGTENDGTFTWTVPSLSVATCRVQVVAYDGDGQSGADASAADFTISPAGPEIVFEELLDADPGWATEGSWAWGTPTGGGGEHGPTDPSAGYTGANVYGYNLAGDYETNLTPTYLTMPALDCTGMSNVTLSFWRWLGVEKGQYDRAAIEVNVAGTWQSVWENAYSQSTEDAGWTYQEIALSPLVDDRSSVAIRWVMGKTDGTWNYCGWNIDDVRISAVVPATLLIGDANCDGSVNFFDIDYFVAALTGESAWSSLYASQHAGATPPCPYENNDTNGDGTVDFFDIDPFVVVLTQQ